LSFIEYRAQREKIGSLDCIVVRPEGDTRISKIGVFCHGFGAPGDDLASLAGEFLENCDGTDGIELVFPAAPIALDNYGMPGARAWWLLSIARLIAAFEDGRYDQVREEVPEGIDDARQLLTSTINLLLERRGLTTKQLVLGGFSQGAMLSMDAACRGLESAPAGLCLFSGALICERQWLPAAARLSEIKILQSHGRQDAILPFQAGVWLRDLLTNAGCNVDFVAFNGPHTIPMESIEKAGKMLSEL
jgi:phospholipase/carboxylesterase